MMNSGDAQKPKEEDAKCKKDLFCVDANCEGVIHNAEDLWQTENCLKVSTPTFPARCWKQILTGDLGG